HQRNLLSQIKYARNDRTLIRVCISHGFEKLNFFIAAPEKKKMESGPLLHEIYETVDVISGPNFRAVVRKRCDSNPFVQTGREAFPYQPLAHIGDRVFVRGQVRSRQHIKVKSIPGERLAISVYGMRQGAHDFSSWAYEFLLLAPSFSEHHNTPARNTEDSSQDHGPQMIVEVEGGFKRAEAGQHFRERIHAAQAAI